MTAFDTLLITIGILTMLLTRSVEASTPSPGEMEDAHGWGQAHFAGRKMENKRPGQLTVLANNDPVQRNGRHGEPLRIDGVKFTRGLYCHAVSKIAVQLPGPCKEFSALVGVDSNEQTCGGRGSVVFAVRVGGKEPYRSPVMREGMPASPVRIDLHGADEMVLLVDDGGDGISCDQSDWADAKVVLMDGREVWLGDLPFADECEMSPDLTPPFSFNYNKRSSKSFLSEWKTTRSTRMLRGGRTKFLTVYTDPATGLEVRCEGLLYDDFPILEWKLCFRNTGERDTPIISEVQAIDTVFHRGREGEFLLHHNSGSQCIASDYQPFQTLLSTGTNKRIGTSGGRSSNSDFPYFNIQWPSRGVIAAIGWPGQWAVEFTRDSQRGLRVHAGQELTHFTLHPGEEVRSPLIALQFYRGSDTRAQNIWRRWMLKHNLPHPEDKPLSPLFGACSSHQFGEMINANDENQKYFIDRYLQEGLKLDYWWMDAGWYINKGGWPNTGTWEVDKARFPGGLRGITDYARVKGVKALVWFEPERVAPGTWLYEKHPEWLLGKTGDQKLLNLGNPEARKWVTDHIDGLINSEGIDLYRNDFNIDPLPYWRDNDSPMRQGITEIRYVEGFLAFWDELRGRHPGMLIDTCASGGRRNDLETLRRSVPLLRSDYILEPIGQQNHTYGIASWIPYYGTGINSFDPYLFRSQMCPWLIGCWDMRPKADFKPVRKLIEQWRKISGYWLADYYPLTSYRVESDVWMAWQFNKPEDGEGMVQAFRRPDCAYEAARFPLRELEPDAVYAVANLDKRGSTRATGKDLMNHGLPITIKDKPGAAIILYKRLP